MASWSEKAVWSTLYWETDPLLSLTAIQSIMWSLQCCVRQLSLNRVCSCLTLGQERQSGSYNLLQSPSSLSRLPSEQWEQRTHPETFCPWTWYYVCWEKLVTGKQTTWTCHCEKVWLWQLRNVDNLVDIQPHSALDHSKVIPCTQPAGTVLWCVARGGMKWSMSFISVLQLSHVMPVTVLRDLRAAVLCCLASDDV